MHFAMLIASYTIGFPSAEELENGVLESRRALVSGHVVAKAEVDSRHDNTKVNLTYHIWYNRDHYRIDFFKGDARTKDRESYCENCERPNYYVWYAEKPIGLDGKRLALSIMEPRDKPGAAPTGRFGENLKIDARVFGVTGASYDLLGSVPLTGFLKRTDRTAPTISKIIFRDKPAWQMEYVLNVAYSPRVIMVFSPDQRNSLTRSVVQGTIGNVKHVDTMEVWSKKFDETWFPEKISYEKTVGDIITHSERWNIEVAEFNKPIPASIFALKGMNIDPMRIHIMDRDKTRRGSFEWDGKNIVPVKQDFAALHPDLPPNQRNNHRPLTIAIAIGLFCVGGFFFRRHLRLRSGA